MYSTPQTVENKYCGSSKKISHLCIHVGPWESKRSHGIHVGTTERISSHLGKTNNQTKKETHTKTNVKACKEPLHYVSLILFSLEHRLQVYVLVFSNVKDVYLFLLLKFVETRGKEYIKTPCGLGRRL